MEQLKLISPWDYGFVAGAGNEDLEQYLSLVGDDSIALNNINNLNIDFSAGLDSLKSLGKNFDKLRHKAKKAYKKAVKKEQERMDRINRENEARKRAYYAAQARAYNARVAAQKEAEKARQNSFLKNQINMFLGFGYNPSLKQDRTILGNTNIKPSYYSYKNIQPLKMPNGFKLNLKDIAPVTIKKSWWKNMKDFGKNILKTTWNVAKWIPPVLAVRTIGKSVDGWYNRNKKRADKIFGLVKRNTRKLHVAEVPEEAKEYADFAELARNDDKEIPKNNIELNTSESLEAYGLSKEMLSSNGTGFKAKVFLNTVTGELTISFSGTDPLSVKDWLTDIKQAFGFETGQYGKAKRIAEGLMDSDVDLSKVTFVGHSLGGGLASLAGAITGSRTVTFNSAGVHNDTLKNAHAEGNDTSNITAYIHNGDVLKYLQEDEKSTEKFLPDPLGNKVYYGSEVHNLISGVTPTGKVIRIVDGIINHPEFKE